MAYGTEGEGMETGSQQTMLAQIRSQPALVQEICTPAEELVRATFERLRPQRWQAVYTAGCGDSYYAGLACEMAFARLCRLPVRASPAMHFSRYLVDNLPASTVLFGISHSGNVSRTIEAVAMARAAGATTIAVTGHRDSGIVHAAEGVLALSVPALGRSPGLRSYTVQLVLLLLSAVQLGEIRQVLSAAAARVWRQQLRSVAGCMEATLAANEDRLRQLAERLGDEEEWVFVGAGPSYATALFCAAKLVEACGVNAWAQELEEWGHIQFFNRRPQTPTCLIVPAGRSVDRALELLPYMKGIGRQTLVVADSRLPLPPTQVDALLPVPQAVDEIFSPLVYGLAGELLAHHLAEIKGTAFFCADRPGSSSGGDRLRASHTLRRLADLSASGAAVRGED